MYSRHVPTGLNSKVGKTLAENRLMSSYGSTELTPDILLERGKQRTKFVYGLWKRTQEIEYPYPLRVSFRCSSVEYAQSRSALQRPSIPLASRQLAQARPGQTPARPGQTPARPGQTPIQARPNTRLGSVPAPGYAQYRHQARPG